MTEPRRTNRGKWSKPGVPHKGWKCVDMYDDKEGDGDDSELTRTCDMCESELIRHVHVMKHDAYPEELHCGCVCAGWMSGEMDAAKQRDRELKNRMARQRRFVTGQAWRNNRNGNPRFRFKGYTFTIFPNGPSFKMCRTRPATETKFFKADFKTEEDAKIWLFKHVDRAKQEA